MSEDTNKKGLKKHTFAKPDMDHPEQYETDEESLFDKFESEKNVDPLPIEDLNQEVKEERNKTKTKDSSSSEKKFPG